MKGSTLSKAALFAALSITLVGCGSEEAADVSKVSQAEHQAPVKTAAVEVQAKPRSAKGLSMFMKLHSEFCEKTFTSRESLVSTLDSDSRFQPAKGFIGVYETKVDGISYAVSPEVDGCTTDVLVKNRNTGEVLFSYDQMNQALQKVGYQEIGKESVRKDMGTDQQEVTILEKTFLSPAGEQTNLDFPSNGLDRYYMTLFVKKFEAPLSEESISLNN